LAVWTEQVETGVKWPPGERTVGSEMAISCLQALLCPIYCIVSIFI